MNFKRLCLQQFTDFMVVRPATSQIALTKASATYFEFEAFSKSIKQGLQAMKCVASQSLLCLAPLSHHCNTHSCQLSCAAICEIPTLCCPDPLRTGNEKEQKRVPSRAMSPWWKRSPSPAWKVKSEDAAVAERLKAIASVCIARS